MGQNDKTQKSHQNLTSKSDDQTYCLISPDALYIYLAENRKHPEEKLKVMQ